MIDYGQRHRDDASRRRRSEPSMPSKKPWAMPSLSILVAATALALGGCGSDDSGSESAPEPSPSMATSESAGATSYDVTLTGAEEWTGQGSDVSCGPGFWSINDSGSGISLGVSGVPNGDGEVEAKALTAKLAVSKAAYLSMSSDGFSISDDGLTVTMDSVALDGAKGSVDVSGTMTCAG
jgi:hypothetical protein